MSPMALGLGLGIVYNGGLPSGPFDPASLFSVADNGYVYDASDSSKVFLETSSPHTPTPDGNVLGTILDSSGKSNNCSAPSVFSRPTWYQVGYIDFDGLSSYLHSTFTFAQPATIIASVRITSESFFGTVIDGVANNFALFQNSLSGGELKLNGSGTGITGFVFSAGEDFVFTIVANGASSKLAKNSNAYLTGNPGSDVLGGVTFAADLTGNNKASMRLYRAVGINRILTNTEISNTREWCAETAGIVL